MNTLFLVAALLGQGMDHPMGHLIIAGGGPMIPDISQRALALAGGKKAHVLIIPFASARTDTGQRSEQMWRQAGAEQVAVLDFADHKAALTAVQTADLIWISGGSQGRLMGILKQQGIIDAIRERFRQGGTVGGTSAGAAVMSLIMLTGDAQLDRLTDGATKTAEGLGLWSGVIIDQHYLRRSRFNRLLIAVLDHPDNVGIGIDECTAVVVEGRTFEVIGQSNVVVIDARHKSKIQTKDGEPAAAADVALHVLRAGMRFSLDKGLLPELTTKVSALMPPVHK
jgi:cyanophycinase